MKISKKTYFLFTYGLFVVYMCIFYKIYSLVLSSKYIADIVSNCKVVLFGIVIVTIVCLLPFDLLKKKKTWEIPVIFIASIIIICMMAIMASIMGFMLKELGLYKFIPQILVVACFVFVFCFLYGVNALRDLGNTKLDITLGVTSLILIVVMNIFNIRERFWHILVDIIVLMWFMYGTAEDSQNIVKNYPALNSNIKTIVTALENAFFLCFDFILIFTHLMKMTADEKE